MPAIINTFNGTYIEHVDTYIAEQHNQSASSGESTEREQSAQQPTEPSAEQSEGEKLFCRITAEAYEKGHAKEVEAELRSAAVSAPKLVKAIRTNEALKYLDTENLNSAELYRMLDEHFHLPFKIRTFQDNRGK